MQYTPFQIHQIKKHLNTSYFVSPQPIESFTLQNQLILELPTNNTKFPDATHVLFPIFKIKIEGDTPYFIYLIIPYNENTNAILEPLLEFNNIHINNLTPFQKKYYNDIQQDIF